MHCAVSFGNFTKQLCTCNKTCEIPSAKTGLGKVFFLCVCVCFCVKDQAMLWTVIVQGEVEAVLCQSSGQGLTPGCDSDRGWVKNNLSVLHSQHLCRLLNVSLAFMGTEVIAHIKLFTFP